MSKFQVLAYNKAFLSYLGVDPYRFTGHSNEFAKSILPYYIFIVGICSFVSGSAFIFKNWPHIEVISLACLITIGTLQTSCMFFCLGLNMIKVKEMHIQLQEIVDTSGEF